MVDRLHDQTGFLIEPGGKLIMTMRGSRQGCRFGSVIFNAVDGVTLSELLEKIKSYGARMMCNHGSRAPPWKHKSDSLHTNKQAEPAPIIDMTYVDVEAIDNDSLVSSIKQVANMVDKTMSSHWMAVNWDPGKTEAIVLCAGKHTRACQRECNGEGVPGVLLENGRVCRSVQKYKHFGSMVSATPSPVLEIRERIKKATRAFHALARKVFLQHEIDIKLRIRMFNALVVSILLYNTETWVPTRVQVR